MTSTKAIETRTIALEDALLSAKKKAEEMAAVLNMSIGSPVLVTENPRLILSKSVQQCFHIICTINRK